MRVLHLIDPGSPGGGACTLRLLAEAVDRLRSVESDILVIGNRAHADLARRCDVPLTGVLSPPINHPALARRGLARTLRLYERAGGAYDLIHAWTATTAGLAALATPPRKRVVTLMVGPAGGSSSIASIRRVVAGSAELFAASPAIEREYRAVGASESALSVIPPAVNSESVEMGDAGELRERWEVDEETFVVALLYEPAGWGDARTAINVVLRVATTGRRARLLVQSGASRRAEVERWAGRLGRREMMIVDDEVAEPWRVLPGVDAALFVGGDVEASSGAQMRWPLPLFGGGDRVPRPTPSILPMLWAMSAGVPVIASDAGDVAGIVEDGRTGLLVEAGNLNAASDRIMRLIDDPTIAGRLGQNAREHVRRNFHVSAYCVRLKEAYERLAASSSLPGAPAVPDAPDAPDAPDPGVSGDEVTGSPASTSCA